MVEAKKVSEMSPEEIKDAVKETYTKTAQPTGASCCGSPATNGDSSTGKEESSTSD